jgi:aromatic-L-amino-acid decarboxylase
MTRVGDMDAEEFRREAHRIVDWIADYLAHPEKFRVLSSARPGDIRDALPASAPEHGEPFDRVFADFERTIVPGLTHWNHPGFFAYFATSASGPGILAETLAAGLNVQAMLWRTSPAATELEDVTLGWLARLIGLPPAFGGVIYDTASISTLHALACARTVSVPHIRSRGLSGTPGLRVYFSEDAHSSVEKAIVLLGIGLDGACRIPVDARRAMRVEALERAIEEDLSAGRTPAAVVATAGTTSTTAVDPVAPIADVCRRHDLWLHVDAAYAGAAAMLPECRQWFDGMERADSIVINPHKWLFTPFDLSVLFCRRMDVLHETFSLVPEYLRTPESPRVRNLMDTGIQLGRRFRALKLWMILRYFGADGIRARLAEHMRLARLFASWVDADQDFERLADVPFSVVCFRCAPARVPEQALDALNEQLLDRVNASGEVFLSHTKLDGKLALRLAVCQIRTTESQVAQAWELLSREAAIVLGSASPERP